MNDQYVIFVGKFDHKLGPVGVVPQSQCALFAEAFENPRNVIQDGLNTSAGVLTIRGQDYSIQVQKFFIEDPALRGGQQRCALFCVVPPMFPLLAREVLEEKGRELVTIAENNEKEIACPESDAFLINWVGKLNHSLTGDIGQGQLEHLIRDLSNSVIGNAELLLDGVVGILNEEQHDTAANILACAHKMLCAVVAYITKEETGQEPNSCSLE
ncbi:MAG TPA: hypothetical protein VKK79_14725 [Candidatus Lokiarchaeia archaeon]|nr:hypothetical protein [Candidatus Lokiarchaeia archaeon]